MVAVLVLVLVGAVPVGLVRECAISPLNLQQRMKDVTTRGYDRFFLITTEDYPACIKVRGARPAAVLRAALPLQGDDSLISSPGGEKAARCCTIS